MEWSDFEVFLTAVRAGSYTAAGRHLNINRTTVGRRIEALEAALGTTLFEETPHGPAPTIAGHRLLAAAEAMEREVNAMLDDYDVAGRLAGPVRIAGTAGIAAEFLPEIAAFRRIYPTAVVELLGELDPIDAVSKRRADLAIALVRNPPLRLAGRKIGTVRQAVYALRGAGPLTPLGWGYEVDAALSGGPATITNPSGGTAEQSRLASFNNWADMKQAVLAGLGSASLWCFAVDSEPTLERLTEPDPRHDCPVWLLHRGKAPPGRDLAKLLEFLGTALAARFRPGEQR